MSAILYTRSVCPRRGEGCAQTQASGCGARCQMERTTLAMKVILLHEVPGLGKAR